MDGAQYDLYLFLLTDYELRGHRETLEAAQRLSRHQGATVDDFTAELEAVRLEQDRRDLEAARKRGVDSEF